jgi:hypothetical protein
MATGNTSLCRRRSPCGREDVCTARPIWDDPVQTWEYEWPCGCGLVRQENKETDDVRERTVRCEEEGDN